MWLTRLKAIFFIGPIIILGTTVLGTISLIASVFDSTGRAQHGIAKAWSRMLLWVGGVKVTVEGLEKIPPGGSFVFVANHRSYFDIPVMLVHLPAQVRFLANQYVFRFPFIGFHLKRAGHLPVDSANPRESLKSMSEAARVIPEKEISVLLFPEGTRTKGEMRPFKDGAAYIAIKAGVPVVPIGLTGTREVLPRDSLLIRGGAVRMRVGDPIATLDLGLQDRTRLTQLLYQRVCELAGVAPEQVSAGS